MIPGWSLNLLEQKNEVAVIVASFAFTMLGFLAAVITILFSFSRSRVFKKYKNQGRLDVFFAIYYCAIFSLVVTFFLALLTLSNSIGLWAMRGGLMSTINNLAQIGLLTVIIVSLSRKSIRES